MNGPRRLIGSRAALGLGGVLALGAILAWATPAAAHALLVSSDPARDTSLASAPATIVLTFTEAADPRLSTVTILDSAGRAHGPTRPSAVAGHPDELSLAPGKLADGVYTVSWRTVSSVDGHLAAGSFAFSVGVAPPTGPASAAGAQVASQPLSVAAAHFVLYLGLLVLLGATLVAAFLALVLGAALLRLSLLAWFVAAVGTVALGAAQAANAGAGLFDLPGTSLGAGLLLRALTLLAAGACLLAARRAWGTGRQRPALLLAALSTAAALLADAILSHAGAGGWLAVLIQWLHLLAVGAWLGGLPALLLELGACTPRERATVAWRFARLATVGIGAVALTGILRAVTELVSPADLVTTGFGQLLVVKSALLVVLAGLGALNHFRHAPAAGDSLTGLVRTARAEMVVAVVVLLVSSQLGNLVPPAEAGATGSSTPTLTASGHDFGTSVRLRLTVSPGVVGPDTFTAVVADYDTGGPVRATGVQLHFTLPARPDVGASDLDLKASPTPGTFSASGSNLSIEGTWQVTALVQAGLASVEVPLSLSVHAAPPVVDVDRVPGNPTIYTVHLVAGDTVQVYLDPDKPGVPNDLHATYFDAQGDGLAVTAITATVAAAGGPPATVVLQTLDPGHVVGKLADPIGPQAITFTGTAPDGTVLHAHLTIAPGS